uniref:ARAD1D12386p n=1 Tax=Blastobotrys adeninivorans TaxID=409370 RepID=A0A060T8L2_BLAAD
MIPLSRVPIHVGIGTLRMPTRAFSCTVRVGVARLSTKSGPKSFVPYAPVSAPSRVHNDANSTNAILGIDRLPTNGRNGRNSGDGDNGSNSQKFGSLWLLANAGALAAVTTDSEGRVTKTEEESAQLMHLDGVADNKDADTFEEALYDASVHDNSTLMRQRNTILWRVFMLFERHLIEPIITFLRFIELSALFLPVVVSMPMMMFGSRDPSKGNERAGAILWYRFLTFTMELAGPSFIKLGQWAASRTDIFSEVCCDYLSRMHSNAKAHSFRQTKRIVMRAFNGLEFDEIFEEFEEKPLGVGAMAQVYRAKLKPGIAKPDVERRPSASSSSLSKESSKIAHITRTVQETLSRDTVIKSPPSNWVVIKVLHPHVRSVVERDLKIMNFFASMINMIPTMEWLSLPGEVAIFGHMMRLQLDLRIEAENLLMFRHNFEKSHDITFPRPYPEYTSREVLVEEYIKGIPMERMLKHVNAQDESGKFAKATSDKGLDAFLKMLLLDNFIHSDLHPGNIYVRMYRELHESWRELTVEESDTFTQELNSLESDSKAWLAKLDEYYQKGYRPQVCFIDAGLVTELNAVNRRNFLDLFKAISAFDGYRVGELMIERSRTPETAIDPELFAFKVERLVLNIKQRTFTLGSVKLGDLLWRVLSMVRQHHVRMEGDFITVVLSILLLEGIGRQLDPELDLFKSSLPIIRQLGPHERGDVFSKYTLSMAKVWVALEVRQFITASIQDIHNLVKYDQLCPNQ